MQMTSITEATDRLNEILELLDEGLPHIPDSEKDAMRQLVDTLLEKFADAADEYGDEGELTDPEDDVDEEV